MKREILFLSLRERSNRCSDILKISNFFIRLPHKVQNLIIWSKYIHHFLPTFLTFLTYHFALPFSVINTYWLHKSMALRKTISRLLFIDMEWIETVRTVISSAPRRVSWYFFLALYTREWFISHDKTHILVIYLLSRKRKALLFCKNQTFLLS